MKEREEGGEKKERGQGGGKKGKRKGRALPPW